MTTHSRAERAALAELMAELGPDAPTLCTGWTTYDLAAHLVARDRRPDSTPGLLVPAFAGWTERVRRGEKANHDYPELVERVRRGAPVWSPMSLPMVESASNTVEFFLHHEDVRRAQPGWRPRELSGRMEESLWRRLRASAKLMLRAAPTGVWLVTPDGHQTIANSAEPMVTLTGPPSELVLYCSGRQSAARVEATGDAAAVAKLFDAPLGI
jgi:uncharacterized protein (TIGR03085 family)